MKIVTVVPLKRGVLKGDLTYFTSLDVSIGNIVYVPIRSKKVLALVVSCEELQDNKSNVKGMNFNLKKVIENKGSSVFLKEYFDAISDTSRYFAQNINRVIVSLIPNIFIEEYDKIAKFSNLGAELPLGSSAPKLLRSEKLLFQYPIQDRISIYKTLIRESFAKGKSIFMVLPTEFDINDFTNQLSKGIEKFTFSLHSGINAKKNLTTYEKIMTSSHPVLIIGTPPFLAIPRKDISTIILERENSNAYRMIRKPYIDLRTFVEIYASKINAKLILADEILRFETIARKDIDNINPLHPLSFRIDFAGKIEVIGKENKEKNKKSFQIFDDKSIEEIKLTLENKKSVFIFSLRKGLATITICRDCGETISCKECEAPLVLYLSRHGQKRMFVCNRCTKEIDGDIACKSCGSWNLMPLGIGTDTVHEEVEKIFPNTKIFKLDKESAKTKSGAKKIIKEFEENPASILIGTEMAFFYLKPARPDDCSGENKVSLSVIASFDSLWSIPNFKMSEKIIQIIFSLINTTKDKLIIQTKNDNDEAILAIKSGNLLSFIRAELEDRKQLNYPPFKRFIKITYLGDKEETLKARKILEENFKEYSPEIFSGFVAKLKEKYLTNALIKIDHKKWSLPSLSLNSSIDEILLNKLLNLSFEVSVDPDDLL